MISFSPSHSQYAGGLKEKRDVSVMLWSLSADLCGGSCSGFHRIRKLPCSLEQDVESIRLINDDYLCRCDQIMCAEKWIWKLWLLECEIHSTPLKCLFDERWLESVKTWSLSFLLSIIQHFLFLNNNKSVAIFWGLQTFFSGFCQSCSKQDWKCFDHAISHVMSIVICWMFLGLSNHMFIILHIL